MVELSIYDFMQEAKMKFPVKKLLFVSCAVAVLALFSALSAFAVDYSENAVLTGDCGKNSNVYWEIVPNDDGTEDDPMYSMYIFGEGKTFKNVYVDEETGKETNVGYSTYDKTQWKDYLSTLTRVYVGDNITTLSGGAFMRNSAIQMVELGANVTTLGSATFEGCTNLTKLYRKGNTPVEGTFNLTGITSISSYLFDGCKYVENIILPTEGSYSLSLEFLKNNEKLKSIYIPKACTKISALAFRYCYALENIYIEGDTVIEEGEISKGNEGSFYAYAFHVCGVDTDGDGVRTFSISAIEGSPAHDYALRNAAHSITTTNSSGQTATTEYAINFIEPYDITVMEDGETLVTTQVVSGFFVSHQINLNDATYIIFADEGCTTFISEKPTDNTTVYAKKLLYFKGFMVRSEEYHGLRAIYEYNTDLFKNIDGYSITEVGILGTKLCGIDPVITKDDPYISKTIITDGTNWLGKLLELPKNGIATFAYTATGYEVGSALSASRASSRIISRAYVTVKNETTGETYTYYSVQSEKDLIDTCDLTLKENEKLNILDSAEIAFIKAPTELGVDPDYIYSKTEALEYLTAVYEDDSLLLSGQHIGGYGKYVVRETLNNVYENSGEMPAVLSYDAAVAYRSAGYSDENNAVIADDFAEFAKQGGLVTICAHMANPDPDADPKTLVNGVYRGKLDTLEKWDDLFKDGTEINENFMTELSAIADFLQMLEDRDVTVFWRPLHEMNGAWFWFCGASVPTAGTEDDRSVEYCIRLWKFIYNYLKTERGLDNLLWVFSPNIANDGNTSSTYDIMKYYPGDTYVDVCGIDIYHTTDTLAGKTPLFIDSQHTDNWSRLAGVYDGDKVDDKTYNPIGQQVPVVYGEFGPGESLRNADRELSYDGADALDFVKKVQNSGRDMGWIVFWSGWSGSPISLDTMYLADVFMKDDFIIDLSESRTLVLARHYGN